MRNPVKFLVISTLATVILTTVTFSSDAISVSHIQGLDDTPGLMTNTTIRYYLHYEVGEEFVSAVGNPLELYSPDGASWQTPITMPMIMLSNYLDGYAVILNYGGGGAGADTLDLYGFSISRPGFPAGFSQDVFFIQTRLADSEIGKTLCLDSVWNQNTNWVWASLQGAALFPTWNGPHCYQIVDCCVGNRGDVNGDEAGPNIVDLNRLVNTLFRGAPMPDCRLESDVNGDGMSGNVVDLNYLVNYIHRGGPAAPACP
ncbi:MAG TPA: hypothetical protein VHP63_05430 [candidate division Zixibacteria bacterium]|nr:hypothetical protein [candidate division Zixibacteria bacterium]